MNWMKYRLLYFAISAFAIGAGIYGYFKWGFKFGIDFTGGVLAEYKLSSGENKVFKFGPLSQEESEKIRLNFKSQGAQELSFESVGPSVGPDLIKKTLYAMGIATTLILFWIAIQFKSLKFGISATLATLHDTLVLLGSFTLLGHFYGAEVDFLFVTAILTVLSFSVHDTIVVYDRIRENMKKEGRRPGWASGPEGGELIDVANKAISETMVRSLNNSFTIIFMLIALILLGGETIKWFAVALLVGTISGTYSSPFVAVPLLVTWDLLQKKLKKV